MPPEVLLRKLTYLRQLLTDLAPFKGATLADVQAEHYKVERLFELLVMASTDILFHELAERGLTPDSYRGAFKPLATGHRSGYNPGNQTVAVRCPGGSKGGTITPPGPCARRDFYERPDSRR